MQQEVIAQSPPRWGELTVSPGTKLEVTKKDLGDLTKDVLVTLQTKKQVNNMLLVLVEIAGEKS